MRLLITGFEPFGGSDTNITQEIISLLPAEEGNREIVTLCLPVSFQRAPIALQQAIAQHHPHMLLLLGQCPEGEYIRLERFAMNMMDAQKRDNDDYIPSEVIIYPYAPLAYCTPLHVKEIVSYCQQMSLPVVASNSAGLFVCNRVYYEALHLQQQAIFLHIPKNFSLDLAINIIQKIASKLVF